MKPMYTRQGNKATLDLSKPMLLWMVVFAILAWSFHSFTLLIVALLPVILWLIFAVGILALACIMMLVFYAEGKPIKLRGPKGTRTVQRKK